MIIMRIALRFMLLWGTALLVLTACGGASDPASDTVEQYLKAMVSSDSAQTAKLACKDFEDQAAKDADSFAGVKAALNQATCKNAGSDGNATLVSCSGKIDATYGNEQQNFDLAGPVYKVIQQDGNWLVCGRQ
jgi:hypothetical protein